MSTLTRQRRTYTEKFKRDAISLVTDQGYSAAEAARSLDINDNLIYKGRKEFESRNSGVDLSDTERAEMMAINLRKPGPGLIHHSDRGSQYASHQYQRLLHQHGMVVSMSRKGNCWDNAPVERFFSSLKCEWTGDRLCMTRQAVMSDIKEYIAIYYNAKRLHSTLGSMTPVDFEKIA